MNQNIDNQNVCLIPSSANKYLSKETGLSEFEVECTFLVIVTWRFMFRGICSGLGLIPETD